MVRDLPAGPVILQVLPALQGGGVERSAVEITHAVARAGGRPLVASSGGRLVGLVLRFGGEHLELPLASKSPWRMWRNAQALAALIRDREVAIVHARSRAPAWSAWLACRWTGARFVTTCHGVYQEDFPGKRRYNAVMTWGERVIANSRFIAGEMARRHQVGPDRMRVIPRGVDPAIFDPDIVVPDRLVRLTQAWRLADGQRTVVLPARISPTKGQDVLLRAVARMRHQDFACVLVGGADGRARWMTSLLGLAEELGIADRVRLVGHCEDMPAALLLSDIVVAPAVRPEAFGRTVIEAQAMKRLVVAADHGGAVETIEPGVTGWLVPPGDVDALAARLDALLDLPQAERLAAGARARAAVIAHYTVQAMQDATIAVYAELL
jgi:glycosyltransferase involved in cell wall biosynthesis